MAIIGGVTVTGFIAPSTTGDTYAVIDPKYGIDGLRSVSNSTERNSITTLRRREGMLAYQQDDGVYYKLLPPPWTNSDSDWSPLSITSGSTIQTVVYFSATTTPEVYFNSILPITPLEVEKTELFVNGIKYRYGNNYIITGGTSIIWTGPFDIDLIDELSVTYLNIY